MEIKDIQKQHYLGNLKFRDHYLVYTKANMNSDLSGYDYNLYMYDTNSKENIQLTSSNSDRYFDFIDDSHILFMSKRDQSKGTSFYTMSLKGGEATPLFTIPANVSKIKKLEDDTYLLIAVNDISYEDYLLSEKKEEIDRLKAEEKDYEVVDELPYVANGRGFINKLRKSLYLFNGKSFIKLSPEYLDVQDYCIHDHEIYFFGHEYTLMDDQTSSLYQVSLPSIEAQCLLDHRLSIHHIAYIEDRLMIIGHDSQKYEFNKNPEIFYYDKGDIVFCYDYDTSFASKVGTDCRLVGGSSFEVKDNRIYTTLTSYSHADIYSFSFTEPLSRITNFKGCVDNLAIGDQIYFIGMKDEHLQEIYVCLESGAIEKLTDFGKEYEKLGWSKPVPVTYTKGDFDYEGYVIYPFDFDPQKKYPGILEIHGGPKVASGDIYDFEYQLMASKGYFVFFTNPRGSDGRGNRFADVYGKMGVIDYQDIMDFVDVVLERIPQIDENRLGVTGGSYGGYMTNWIIGHTSRFKAAVSQRSISNYVSKSLTTDIGYYHNMKQTMATPWSNVEKMWFHSPLKYACNATTPTLFIQSDEDYRCYQADAYQMYQALILNGCKARMCIFHGENHELSRGGKPKHRIRRLTEMMNWFNQYIGG